jgi:hypothetical protein
MQLAFGSIPISPPDIVPARLGRDLLHADV